MDIGINDAVDNRILYALSLDAAHILVTEDRGIHDTAASRALVDRVMTIQTAEDFLRRLHLRARVQLPNIEDVPLYSLTPYLSSDFFSSLRTAYPGFDEWFKRKAREDERAWLARSDDKNQIGALCVYLRQENERITEEGTVIQGPALKLGTFKVAPGYRGRKVGELMLKAAFRYASLNELEHIFIHGDRQEHHFLFQMLEDFGFTMVGTHPGSDRRDVVYLKEHPVTPPPPEITPFEYTRRFFPHFRSDEVVSKYLVPILPHFHEMLFPDYRPAQGRLEFMLQAGNVGNAIKLAYLSHAQTKAMHPGDIVLFYRSHDEKAVTSIGVVESYEQLGDSDTVARKVKRRTVYSLPEIQEMAQKPIKVMLFRLVRHLERTPTSFELKRNGILRGTPQSITKISHENFSRIIALSR